MSAITYLLQVSGCITLFYAFYYACLSRLTFFSINRYYLVSSLLLSFIIPLITIPVYSDYTVLTNTRVVQLPQVITAIAKPSAVFHPIIIKHSPITWIMVLKWVYIVGCALFSLRFLFTLAAFFLNLRKQKVEHSDGLHIIRSDKKLTNGSFLNYIFLDDAKLKGEEAQQVIAHEILHVRLKHSVDRIAGRVAQIILWFNPVMYLYTRAIEQNHEFEVDSILTENLNKQNYAGLLLQLSVNTNGTIYNSFSKTPLQQRIMMLFNSRSSKRKQLVYLLIVPLLTISFIAFANMKRIYTPKVLDRPAVIITEPSQKNNIAPDIQLENAIANEKGHASGMKTKAAIIDTPVSKNEFKATENNSRVISDGRYSVIKDVDKLGKNPLVLIDGKEYPVDILYKIGNACIRSYGLFLPEGAIQRFGNKGSDGAVQITTKSGTITDQTDVEISNFTTINSADDNDVIRRVTLRKPDGKLYDKIIAQYNGVHYIEVDISHNAKIAIFVDSVFFTEDDAKRVMAEKITKTPERGVAYLKKEKMPDGNLHGYEAVMWFYSARHVFPKTAKDKKSMLESLNWEKYIPVN